MRGENFASRFRQDIDEVRDILQGNIRVLAIRDLLVLLAAGLNGGLTILYTIYVLGADALAIGFLGSVTAVAGSCSVLVGGWMVDRYGGKRMFLLGTGLTMFNPLVYALAPSWEYLLFVQCTAPIGQAIAGPAGFSIRVFSVDRHMLTKATAALYTTHQIANMVVPPIGAAVVTLAGGLESLRIVYVVQAFIEFGAWLYAAKRLEAVKLLEETSDPGHSSLSLRGFFSDFQETYKVSRREGTWTFLLLSATSPWVFSIDGSWQTVYAEQACKSPLIVIGLLPTVSAMVAMLLYIPVANLAERRGRMDVVIKIRPLQYLGYVTYILAGTFFIPGVTPYIPLLVWGVRSAGGVAGPGWEVASIEAMPHNRLAKWLALQGFVSRVLEIPAPMVGGLLWNLDPRAPFIWHLCVDGLIRYNIMRRIAKTQASKRTKADGNLKESAS